jgi:hypothetical protein
MWDSLNPKKREIFKAGGCVSLFLIQQGEAVYFNKALRGSVRKMWSYSVKEILIL